MFEPQHRYSGAAFAFAVGAVLGGGFAPLVATALQTSTGTSLSVSLHMVGTANMSGVTLFPDPLGDRIPDPDRVPAADARGSPLPSSRSVTLVCRSAPWTHAGCHLR
ncbi:hypothetical protein [Pseudonocardia yunnanensis]|uniref:MFS transporter n=1 Tax=Pseudonocardia yunnanensis TaxID=58107 RepID=A0ABW4F6C1_9PSEU